MVVAQEMTTKTELMCDGKRCRATLHVTSETRVEAYKFLEEAGWEAHHMLPETKSHASYWAHYCPMHAAEHRAHGKWVDGRWVTWDTFEAMRAAAYETMPNELRQMHIVEREKKKAKRLAKKKEKEK
jgi:hypothetical protein